MNHPTELNTLQNHYLIMRHGESKANQQDLIVSTPEPLTQSPHLRERFFGDLELTPNSNYQLVWDADGLDAKNIPLPS